MLAKLIAALFRGIANWFDPATPPAAPAPPSALAAGLDAADNLIKAQAAAAARNNTPAMVQAAQATDIQHLQDAYNSAQNALLINPNNQQAMQVLAILATH